MTQNEAKSLVTNFLADYKSKKTVAYGQLGASLAKDYQSMCLVKTEADAQLRILSKRGKVGENARAKAFSNFYDTLTDEYKKVFEPVYRKSEADSK